MHLTDMTLNALTFCVLILAYRYYCPLGPVVQRWISANRGLKFNLLI
jgi:phage tail protein X